MRSKKFEVIHEPTSQAPVVAFIPVRDSSSWMKLSQMRGSVRPPCAWVNKPSGRYNNLSTVRTLSTRFTAPIIQTKCVFRTFVNAAIVPGQLSIAAPSLWVYRQEGQSCVKNPLNTSSVHKEYHYSITLSLRLNKYFLGFCLILSLLF